MVRLVEAQIGKAMDLHGCGASLQRVWELLFVAVPSRAQLAELDGLAHKLVTLNWGGRLAGAIEEWALTRAERARDFETFARDARRIEASLRPGFESRFGGHCGDTFDALLERCWRRSRQPGGGGDRVGPAQTQV